MPALHQHRLHAPVECQQIVDHVHGPLPSRRQGVEDLNVWKQVLVAHMIEYVQSLGGARIENPSPASVARISLFDLKRGENTTGGFPLASPLEVPPVLSIPIIHRFVLFIRSASARKPRFYASAEALCGLPAPGLAMRQHPMESRETVRALPTLQLFRLPSRQSCATRAVLTPSISAASEAVTAGTSERSCNPTLQDLP